jgi:hypothetical protein
VEGTIMRTSFTNDSRLSYFRYGVFSIYALAVLLATPAWAQIELGATAYLDAFKVTTPEGSENRGSLLGGLQAGYRMEPWSFSAEYASGNSVELERMRAELAVAYSLSDSFALTAGARKEDITMREVDYFFFFFVPIGVTATQAEIDLTDLFVGVSYESDPQRRVGLLGSARLYRGIADVSTRVGSADFENSEGYRIQLGVRMGPPHRAIIVGAAYESNRLSDAGVDLTSEPVLFVQYRYRIPLAPEAVSLRQ